MGNGILQTLKFLGSFSSHAHFSLNSSPIKANYVVFEVYTWLLYDDDNGLRTFNICYLLQFDDNELD